MHHKKIIRGNFHNGKDPLLFEAITFMLGVVET